MTTVLVLADTHLREDQLERLPEAVRRHAETVDVILHAGDMFSAALLDDLSAYAPVHAVRGNNDHDLHDLLPETVELVIDGVRIAMVHDSGARQGRPSRMHRRFPDAGIVVFGHSHDPVAEEGVEGQFLFNPGSPTQRRRQPEHTIGLLDLRDGRLVSARHVVVGPKR
jgi:uncharacterized protein